MSPSRLFVGRLGERLAFLEGEREHVGGVVFARELAVEGADLVVVGDDDAELGVTYGLHLEGDFGDALEPVRGNDGRTGVNGDKDVVLRHVDKPSRSGEYVGRGFGGRDQRDRVHAEDEHADDGDCHCRTEVRSWAERDFGFGLLGEHHVTTRR